jgi:type VI secretion system protein ImpH
LRGLEAEPWRYDFFQALRLIECAYPDRPRIGESHRAHEDPVRFAQEPGLAFAVSSLAAFEPGTGGAPPRLLVNLLGLLGPNGPMPLHITEYIRDRVHNSGDRAAARFLDIFHHRMLSLFYRAWASAQPAVSLDRPDSDRFSTYVASLFGLGMPSLRDRDALPDGAKLHYAGLLANQAHCADGLRAILADFLGLPVAIEQFVGSWLTLPDEDHSTLGSLTGTARLGESAVLGARVWSHQHKFRIIVGPLTRVQFEHLLPGGDALRRVVAWVRNYAGDTHAWELRLILRRDDVPPATLGGGARLGWTSWLPGRDATRDADELVLNPVH